METEARFPHCDDRILHAPGKCRYCDLYPEMQKAREEQKISFTGEPARSGWFPCPAEQARSSANLNAWHGNRAYGHNDPDPYENLAKELSEIARKYQKGPNPDDSDEG